jgi:hypothetical protein
VSHLEVFAQLTDGKPDAALIAVRKHVASWPRDARVASTAANQNGLIGTSGRAGREQDQLDFLTVLAPSGPPSRAVQLPAFRVEQTARWVSTDGQAYSLSVE